MSEPLHEILSGKGRLISNNLPTERQVEYEFHIYTEIVEEPGFPKVASKRTSRGIVRPLDGSLIPEGYYQLHAEDGEVLRVKNVGLDQWVILAS